MTPLTIVRDAIRKRVEGKSGEPWLQATYHVVEQMSDRQARIILDALVARPLSLHDADLAEFITAKLGVTHAYTWQHIPLTGSLTGDAWQPGRGHEHAKEQAA
jgi:hypothetical protein